MEKVRRCSSATVASSGSMVFLLDGASLDEQCAFSVYQGEGTGASKLSVAALDGPDGPGLLQLEGGAVPAVRMRCVGSRLRAPAAPVEE